MTLDNAVRLWGA